MRGGCAASAPKAVAGATGEVRRVLEAQTMYDVLEVRASCTGHCARHFPVCVCVGLRRAGEACWRRAQKMMEFRMTVCVLRCATLVIARECMWVHARLFLAPASAQQRECGRGCGRCRPARTLRR